MNGPTRDILGRLTAQDRWELIHQLRLVRMNAFSAGLLVGAVVAIVVGVAFSVLVGG